MEKKILVGLALFGFLLALAIAFAESTPDAVKNHFTGVAQANNFKIFTQSDNLLDVLKKFQDIGGYGAALVYNDADKRFYIIQESWGERDFEVYAHTSADIFLKNKTLSASTMAPFIKQVQDYFVLLDCYTGWGTDYVVPENIWNNPAIGGLNLKYILNKCMTDDKTDFDYTTSGRGFEYFVPYLKKTNALGYTFSSAPTVAAAKKGTAYYQFNNDAVDILKAKGISAKYADIVNAMKIVPVDNSIPEYVTVGVSVAQPNGKDALAFKTVYAGVKYKVTFAFPGYIPLEQFWTFPESDINP